MIVAIRSCVLMPKPDHVTQLMNHNAKLVAVFPDGDGLRPVATATDVGAASVT